MRLMDLIAQGRGARVQADDGLELPGANRFSKAIGGMPVRYVLSNELARSATQLAYAEGDRLSACLDLIHVPARLSLGRVAGWASAGGPQGNPRA